MLIYGRADGMPSFHVSVVVRARTRSLPTHIPHPPTVPGRRGTSPRTVLSKSELPGATLPSTADTQQPKACRPSTIVCGCGHAFSPCLDFRGRPCRPLRTCRRRAPRLFSFTNHQLVRSIHSPPGAGRLVSPSTNGEVFNKSSGHGLTLSSS